MVLGFFFVEKIGKMAKEHTRGVVVSVGVKLVNKERLVKNPAPVACLRGGGGGVACLRLSHRLFEFLVFNPIYLKKKVTRLTRKTV